jgi:hypothetical protein
MDIASIIFWTVVAGLVLYIINIYNHLVRLKHIQRSGITDFDAIAVFDLIARMAPVD